MVAKSAAASSPDLRWKRENRWNDLKAAEKRRMQAYCRKYLGFLSKVKTERQAHDYAVEAAEERGFIPLESVQAGRTLKPGDCVYRSCRGKTMMLARIGKQPISQGVNIVGGHTDCPRLDAKPNPVYEDGGLVLLDTHYYGGIKKYQWVTLPLALHGVVIRKDGQKVNVSVGDDPRDPVFVITDLLPHLAKDQARKKLAEGISGEGLNVLLGSVPARRAPKDVNDKTKHHLLGLLHEKYGITEADFASAELEIVPAGPARELGMDRSMMLGYGHDDRICAYASLQAVLDMTRIPDTTAVVLLCDREEIGSVGATGMDSVFFENTLAELLDCAVKGGYDGLSLRRCMERSRMLSADVSVLHDPNYPEVSSPNNAAMLNAGVIISKYTGARGKAGCSEASAEFMAVLRRLFDDADVFWQTGELGKVDQGGGGTIAMFLARYGMDVVDCGVGLLSMHAPWEVAGKLDAYMASRAYRNFLEHKR